MSLPNTVCIAAERSYRRGCHQTAARIARQIEGMESLDEALNFLDELSDVLGEFRHNNRPHLALLDEAISQARMRVRIRQESATFALN